jgi:hypothetical protein
VNKNGRADDLRKELVGLFKSQNANPRNDTTSMSGTFLRVTVVANYGQKNQRDTQ